MYEVLCYYMSQLNNTNTLSAEGDFNTGTRNGKRLRLKRCLVITIANPGFLFKWLYKVCQAFIIRRLGYTFQDWINVVVYSPCLYIRRVRLPSVNRTDRGILNKL